MPTPAELKRLNLEHFEHVLQRTSNPAERARIEELIQEERAKADTAYPPSRSGWHAHE
jgi:hypothetical protein